MSISCPARTAAVPLLFGIAAMLGLAVGTPESGAQDADAASPPLGSSEPQVIPAAVKSGSRPHAGGSHFTPRSGVRVPSRSVPLSARRQFVAPHPTPKLVIPRTPRAPQYQTRRKAPSRVVVPKSLPGVHGSPKSASPLARQVIRKAPANTALVNRGLLRNPGRNKPANVRHDPQHRAAVSGWMHRHRPFVFRHDGHRWRRHYYSFLVGGLWYWYWYDVVADTDAAAVLYPDAALPDCDLDGDECTEPSLVAPALLEGRASQEDIDRCAAEFPSFDAATGTYLTGSGDELVCPYLE